MSITSWLEEYYPVPATLTSEAGALEHSIKKWEGLLPKNLGAHGLSNPPIAVDGLSCALCNHYANKSNSCDDCPLYQHLGVACGEDSDPWMAWIEDTDPHPMYEALLDSRPEAKPEPEGFDLEAFMAGTPAKTRDGSTAHFLGLYRELAPGWELLCRINTRPIHCHPNGRFLSDSRKSEFDLVEMDDPLKDLQVDEPIMVRDAPTQPWEPRYFARRDPARSRFFAWAGGTTSFTAADSDDVSAWHYARRPTPEELNTENKT